MISWFGTRKLWYIEKVFVDQQKLIFNRVSDLIFLKIERISILELSHLFKLLLFSFLFFNSFCCWFFIIPLLYFPHTQLLLALVAAFAANMSVYLLVLHLQAGNMGIVSAVNACFHWYLFSSLFAYHALQSHFFRFRWNHSCLGLFGFYHLWSFFWFFIRIVDLNNIDFLFRLCN